MKLLIENQLFICINAIKDSIKKESITIEQYETYQKLGFRNKYAIIAASGTITLSIPLLKGRNQHTPIREVKICNEQPWQKSHWKTIQYAYNRSPWFEYYKDSLYVLFRKQHTFLYDFNWMCWEWCLCQLKYNIPLEETKYWEKHYPKDAFLDRRNFYSNKNKLDGLHTIKYNQVFEEKLGFIANVSVLDLLFCEGPNSINAIIY